MPPLRIIALFSGGGRTVMNLLDRIEAGDIPARIELAIASRGDARGIPLCERRGLETAVVPSRDFHAGTKTDWSAMSEKVNALVLPRKPDLVILAGYLCFYHLPLSLQGRAMNIHPALLPAFGGQGMWGRRVHEAVVAAGVKVTGCTVHFVTNEYDRGPIILQRTCSVRAEDTPDAVAARVFAEECMAYPEAIRLFAEDRLRIEGSRVFVKD